MQSSATAPRTHLAPARPKDIRDLAVLLAGRDLPARAGELVSIIVESVTQAADGTARISLRRGKNRHLLRTLSRRRRACAALLRWLNTAGLTSGGAWASPRAATSGTPPHLSASFGAHSLRVGIAQNLIAANLSVEAFRHADELAFGNPEHRQQERWVTRRVPTGQSASTESVPPTQPPAPSFRALRWIPLLSRAVCNPSRSQDSNIGVLRGAPGHFGRTGRGQEPGPVSSDGDS